MQLRDYQLRVHEWALPLVGSKPIAMALPTAHGKICNTEGSLRGLGMKICSKCGIEKEAVEFSKSLRYKDGLQKHCKSCVKSYWKEYRKVNIGKLRKRNREYYTVYKEQMMKQTTRNTAARRKSDPLFAATIRLRMLTWRAFRRLGLKKASKTFALLGCTPQELLEKWEVPEIPPGYHIDHICPLAQAQTADEVAKLCHWTNLQLLSRVENMEKSASKTEEGVIFCWQLLGRDWTEA